MEVYRRITERVRGALWAHHRRLMPERQFQRILAFVYNNKYEYQMRLDEMTVVGSEWGGRVEVAATPAGHIKKVRVHPEFEDLPQSERKALVISAFAKAKAEGQRVMQEAEDRVYGQFLRDIKPIVLGIRDNPEFYTVPDEAVELPHGVLQSAASRSQEVHRTIPYTKAHYPMHEVQFRDEAEKKWFRTDAGRAWMLSAAGKKFQQYYMPELRPRGAPGAKKRVSPMELLAPYTPMDEQRLQRKNWMAYLDNKHVAEATWTRIRQADRLKVQRALQRTGQAWHTKINPEAETRV